MDERVYSKEIVEFVTVGLEFCGRVERSAEADRNDFLLTLTRILPLLYLKASLLPTDEPDEEYDLANYVTEEQYEYLRNTIRDLIGRDDDYLEVFDADMAYSDTPIAASISDGIADIYQDIRDLLEVYRYGDETMSRMAICRCRENFATYWGQKLVNIMRPLHSLCFGSETEGPDEYAAYEQDQHSHDCENPLCHHHHHSS